MKIELIKSNIYTQKPITAKESTKAGEQTNKTSDSLEISTRGQELNKIFDGGKNLDIIREKVNQGFYNSDEVLKKVVDSILKEINQK